MTLKTLSSISERLRCWNVSLFSTQVLRDMALTLLITSVGFGREFHDLPVILCPVFKEKNNILHVSFPWVVAPVRLLFWSTLYYHYYCELAHKFKIIGDSAGHSPGCAPWRFVLVPLSYWQHLPQGIHWDNRCWSRSFRWSWWLGYRIGCRVRFFELLLPFLLLFRCNAWFHPRVLVWHNIEFDLFGIQLLRPRLKLSVIEDALNVNAPFYINLWRFLTISWLPHIS